MSDKEKESCTTSLDTLPLQKAFDPNQASGFGGSGFGGTKFYRNGDGMEFHFEGGNMDDMGDIFGSIFGGAFGGGGSGFGGDLRALATVQ